MNDYLKIAIGLLLLAVTLIVADYYQTYDTDETSTPVQASR